MVRFLLSGSAMTVSSVQPQCLREVPSGALLQCLIALLTHLLDSRLQLIDPLKREHQALLPVVLTRGSDECLVLLALVFEGVLYLLAELDLLHQFPFDEFSSSSRRVVRSTTAA